MHYYASRVHFHIRLTRLTTPLFKDCRDIWLAHQAHLLDLIIPNQSVDSLQRLSALAFKSGFSYLLIFRYIVPENIYDQLQSIPGIEIPSKPKFLGFEAQKEEALMDRIEWHILKMPFFSGIDLKDNLF